MAWNKGKVEASQQHQKGDPKHNGLASGVADTILNEWFNLAELGEAKPQMLKNYEL
jgi:hypothetical protein